MGATGVSRSVLPSGAAAFTACTPMRPWAPARFSTMTGCSRATRKCSAISRASASPEPPAANGKTMRIGSAPIWAWMGTGKRQARISVSAAARCPRPAFRMSFCPSCDQAFRAASAVFVLSLHALGLVPRVEGRLRTPAMVRQAHHWVGAGHHWVADYEVARGHLSLFLAEILAPQLVGKLALVPHADQNALTLRLAAPVADLLLGKRRALRHAQAPGVECGHQPAALALTGGIGAEVAIFVGVGLQIVEHRPEARRMDQLPAPVGYQEQARLARLDAEFRCDRQHRIVVFADGIAAPLRRRLPAQERQERAALEPVRLLGRVGA